MIGRLAFVALVLAVTGAVAHGAAQATWHGMGLYATPAAAPGAFRPAPGAPVRETDLSPVHALAPFGRRIVPPPAPVEVAVPVAPPTPLTLGMTLNGVLVASARARSVAYIALPGTAVAPFRIDESVGDRATLFAVLGDRVVLAEGDRRDTLWLNERDAPAPAPAPGPALTAGIPAWTAPLSGAGAAPAAGGPSGARSVDETIDLYRRRIAVNPKAVLDRFGVSAVPEGGYRVGSSPSEGVVRAGLRTGDVIAEVNGETVGDIEADRRLFERVIAAGFARVKIIRGGQDIVLSFPFR